MVDPKTGGGLSHVDGKEAAGVGVPGLDPGADTSAGVQLTLEFSNMSIYLSVVDEPAASLDI